MSLPSDFDAERRTGIGGSDAAAALGISPWRTPYDLWLEKTGEVEPLVASEPMRWGTLLEPVIAAEYSRRTGLVFEAPSEMLRHSVHSWMIGHLDGRIVGQPRILEVKCAGTSRGWGEPGTDEIPLQYLVQAHHYLVVAEAEIADVAVLIGGNDLREYRVLADPDIAANLIEQERDFWQLVERREPPAPINLADVVHRWGRLAAPGRVIATEAEIAAIDTLHQIRAARTTLDAQDDEAKQLILERLADRGDTLVNLAGELLASWKLDKGRKGYSVEPRPPSRRFLLKA